MIDSFDGDKAFDNADYTGEILHGIECVACKFTNCNFSNSGLTHNDFMVCTFDKCHFSLVRKTTPASKHPVGKGADFSVCNNFLLNYYMF